MASVRVRLLKGTYTAKAADGRLIHYRPPEEFDVAAKVQHRFADVMQIVGDEPEEAPAPNITTRRAASKSDDGAGSSLPAPAVQLDDAREQPDDMFPPEGDQTPPGSGSAAPDEARATPPAAVVDRPAAEPASGAAAAKASKPLQRRATARKA